MASQILSSLSKESHGPYASNWLERLRQIKRIQSKVKTLDNQTTGGDSVQTVLRTNPSGSGNQAISVAVAAAAAAATAAAASSRSKVHMSDFTKYT